jgi:hypothetical protein
MEEGSKELANGTIQEDEDLRGEKWNKYIQKSGHKTLWNNKREYVLDHQQRFQENDKHGGVH